MNKLYYAIILLFCSILLTCKENEIRDRGKDEQELSKLFNQLKTLSQQVACENEADWKFVPYGEQACGGPMGFIAYSVKIDTANFLKLVDRYGIKQREFNSRWSVVSPCALLLAPKGVICENGKPKFVN